MKTTLEICCTVFGWQGGTIHQALEEFRLAPMSKQDAVCNALMRAIDAKTIADIKTAQTFFHVRAAISTIAVNADGRKTVL